MNSFRTIVVALDFSDCSLEVVRKALEQASREGAAVHLLHVVSLPEELDPAARVRPDADAGLVGGAEYVRNVARERLERYQRWLERPGLEVSTHLVHGRVAETIVAVAAELDADLIVMGTHGRMGFYRWVLGSVAAQVMRDAEPKVLVVPAEHRPSCQARSCASCQANGGGAEEQLRASLEG